MDLLGAAFGEDAECFALNVKRRDAVGVVKDLDVVPGYLPTPAGFYCFQKCFLGRESARVALRCGGTFGIAVITFRRSENALGEPWSSRHRFSDAVNFNNVDAGGDDHERC